MILIADRLAVKRPTNNISALAEITSTSAMQALADNSSIRAIQALADIPSIRAMQALADIPSIKAMQALADIPSMKNYRDLASQHQELISGLNKTGQLGGLAEILGCMQYQPALASSVSAKVDAIQTALNEFDSSPQDYDAIAIENLFDELIESVIDLLGQVNEKIEIRSVLLFASWIIPILFSLYLYQQSSIQIEEIREDNRRRHDEMMDAVVKNTIKSEDQENRLKDRLEKLQNKIDELIESENPLEGIFYVVVRPVPVTVERRFHGPVICWLLVGQEVELIERSGKWIRVIAYDFATGKTEVGWVMKKYLRRMH